MDALVARASMIWLSLHPSPASETSAFNKIRAFSRRCAGLLPFRISAASRSRVVAQPYNIFLYENFIRSHDRLRRSRRDESESSNPFKLVEAKH
jgi:hypothetical protein